MKKTLLHILILVFLVNCRNKTESEKRLNILENKEEIEINVEDKKEKTTTENQVNPNNLDTLKRNDYESDSIVRNIFMVAKNPKLINEALELSFQNISETQFLNFKESYDYKIINEKLIQHDSIKFVMKSSNKVYELNNGFGNEVYPISDFYGYLEPLDSYIVGSGGSGIYEMFLLNKATDSVTTLLNHTDGNDNIPRISPNNKRLISFQTDLKETFIGFYTIENNNVISYNVHINNKWNVDDIIWIDNTSVALKVCENFEYEYSKQEQNCLQTKYLKTEIE